MMLAPLKKLTNFQTLYLKHNDNLEKILFLILGTLLLTACDLLPIQSMSLQDNQAGEAQQIAKFSGTIQAGETQQHLLPVAQVTSLTLILISDQSDLSISLFDPSGKTVATQATSPQPVEGALAFEGANYARIDIQTPTEGEWTVSLIAPQSSNYTLLAQAKTATHLNVQVKDYSQNVGETAKIYAALTQGQKLLHPSVVQIELYQAGQPINTFSFHDDGVSPDEKANDGIFSLEVSGQNLVGNLTGEVTAKDGYIQRQGSVSFSFVQPTAKILGVESERLIDENKDGLAEALEIKVKVDIKKTGQYILNAYLDDKNGQPIAYDQINNALDAIVGGEAQLKEGVQSLSLSFSGQQIRSHNTNGPFYIRLILQDQAQGGADIDVITKAHTTQPYPITDFVP
jgi:hypothetical protein